MGLSVCTARAYDISECLQEDSNLTALRACTALLDGGHVDEETREKLRVRRGYAWLAEDDGDAAVEDFSRALQSQPANVKALKGRAKAHTLIAAHDKAIADWTAILSSNPDTAETIAITFERGASHLAAGHHQEALADYARVIELDPKNVKAHIERAHVYAALRDRTKTLQEYDLAQAASGGSYEVYLARGLTAEAWGEKQMAVDNLFAALKINPRGAWDARRALNRLGIPFPSE